MTKERKMNSIINDLHRENLRNQKSKKNKAFSVAALISDINLKIIIPAKNNEKDKRKSIEIVNNENELIHAENLVLEELWKNNYSNDDLIIFISSVPCDQCFNKIIIKSNIKIIVFLFKKGQTKKLETAKKILIENKSEIKIIYLNEWLELNNLKLEKRELQKLSEMKKWFESSWYTSKQKKHSL